MSQRTFPRRFAALLALALLAGAPLAAAQDRTELVRDVRGPTLEAAVTSGLVRALEQVKGLRVDSALGLRMKHAAETLEVTDGAKTWFAHASADDVAAGTILRETAGLVRGYKILAQSQDPKTREWAVDLEVSVPVYDPRNPRPGARRTLALLGFRGPARSFELAGLQVPAAEMCNKLRAQSQERFVQAQKFIVLDRGLDTELQGELRRIASDDVPLAEQVKLGNRLGADFVLAGSVTEFSWQVVPFRVEVTGYEGARVEAAYDVSFELVDVGTGEIRWADTLRRQFGDDELRNLSPRDQEQNLRIADFLVDKAAGALAESVLEQLYPIKVAGIDESTGEIVLAAGDARVQVGDRFAVHVAGKAFVDPDTGESLGGGEQRIATLAVVRVEPRLARALVLAGDPAQIQPGAVCRRLHPGEN